MFAALGSHRDRALVALWVSTGARAAELLGVTCGDIDPGRQLITVIRKGSRALQQLPASPDAFVWLRLYQRQMQDLVPSGGDQPLWWMQAGLQHRQLSVTLELLEGPTVDALLAATQPGDLMVMATHGRGGPVRWFLGSTAEAVIRRATVPVFLVRANENGPSQFTVRRIVVPLDGSARAEEALPMAQDLATRLGIPVHLVTVIDISGSVTLDLAVSAISAERLEEALIQLFTAAESHLARACEHLGDSGLAISTDVLHGEPGVAIPNATLPGDLLVMTTHGRSGPARWVLGSVAEAVVRRSTVPILLMRVNASQPTS